MKRHVKCRPLKQMLCAGIGNGASLKGRRSEVEVGSLHEDMWGTAVSVDLVGVRVVFHVLSS